MKNVFGIFGFLLLCPMLLLAQNDFNTRYFTIAAELSTELPTPELSAFQKKVKSTIYKKSYFSDFTNQAVTSQNFWQPVDIAATSQPIQRHSRVSMERLQAGLGRTQIYGYSTDGKTRVTNEVYDDVGYYSPYRNPYNPYRNYSPYSPYARPYIRRNAIITIGRDN